jgi:hypothetical protein
MVQVLAGYGQSLMRRLADLHPRNDARLLMHKPPFSMLLRWYIATKLLRYAARLIQRDMDAREVRAFNALGDAILADKRWDMSR